MENSFKVSNCPQTMPAAKNTNSKNKNGKSDETKQALQDFKTGIIKSTEKVIKEYLPIKVVQLSELFEEICSKQTEIEQRKYEYDGSEDAHPNNNNKNQNITNTQNKNVKTKKKKRSFNEMSSISKDSDDEQDDKNQSNGESIQLQTNKYSAKNAEIERFTTMIKSEVEELINYLDQIGLFINLHIPKIEDGNNFGVQIQEQMKSMVSGGQLSAQDFLRNIPKFHTLRAKIISKIMKYPNLSDYKKAIIELDFKQMLMLKHCLRDLRNNYWILYDVLTKNWDKIVKPKGDKTSTFNMY